MRHRPQRTPVKERTELARHLRSPATRAPRPIIRISPPAEPPKGMAVAWVDGVLYELRPIDN